MIEIDYGNKVKIPLQRDFAVWSEAGNALAKADMLSSFDEAIKKAGDSPNPFEKMFLLHDKESLVFCGDPELTFADLS